MVNNLDKALRNTLTSFLPGSIDKVFAKLPHFHLLPEFRVKQKWGKCLRIQSDLGRSYHSEVDDNGIGYCQ